MDRLSILLTLMTGAVFTGTLVVTAFTVGLYSWWAVGLSVLVGWTLAWPAALLISRKMKGRDPKRDYHRLRKGTDLIPDLDAREV